MHLYILYVIVITRKSMISLLLDKYEGTLRMSVNKKDKI